MEYLNNHIELGGYWYLVGGIISIIIISFTEIAKHPNGFMKVSAVLLVGYPIVLPLLLQHFWKIGIRSKDFTYTIETGLCKRCGREASINCEIGSSQGSEDSIYTEIDCDCRDHSNSWAHFSENDNIYKYLVMDNQNFKRNNWTVSNIPKEQ